MSRLRILFVDCIFVVKFFFPIFLFLTSSRSGILLALHCGHIICGDLPCHIPRKRDGIQFLDLLYSICCARDDRQVATSLRGATQKSLSQRASASTLPTRLRDGFFSTHVLPGCSAHKNSFVIAFASSFQLNWTSRSRRATRCARYPTNRRPFILLPSYPSIFSLLSSCCVYSIRCWVDATQFIILHTRKRCILSSPNSRFCSSLLLVTDNAFD